MMGTLTLELVTTELSFLVYLSQVVTLVALLPPDGTLTVTVNPEFALSVSDTERLFPLSPGWRDVRITAFALVSALARKKRSRPR